MDLCYDIYSFFLSTFLLFLSMDDIALTHKEIHETVNVTEGEDLYIGMFIQWI